MTRTMKWLLLALLPAADGPRCDHCWRPGVRGYRAHPLQYWELAETIA